MIERFNKIAKEWDSKPERVEGAMRFVEAILDEIDEDTNKFNLLDYGSGSGLVSFGCANIVANIDGLDNSIGMIDVYNEKANRLNLNNIKAKHHDINYDDIKAHYYNLAVTNMTMHHVKDTKMFIEKLSKSLKSGGWLFISDLVTEDGGFHSDNAGVEHFGFNIEDIENIYNEVGLTNVKVKILNTIKKPSSSYDVFIAMGKKV